MQILGMSHSSWILALLVAIPSSHAKSLWSGSPATASDIIRTAYPLGNGRLGAMPFGPAGSETLNINVDSLWSGGPFEIANYTGGNPTEAVSPALTGIRDWIFTNGTGNVTELLGDDRFYGSYRVLGNLSVSIPSVRDSNVTVKHYKRTLDLATGVHTTSFDTESASYTTSVFCTFPDQVCVYRINSTRTLPTMTVSLHNSLVEPGLQNLTCGTEHVRLRGVTQHGPPQGMLYDAVTRVIDGNTVECECDASHTELLIKPKNGTSSVAVVLGAGTSYDAKKGTREHNYSFRGEDPGLVVEEQTEAASTKSVAALLKSHVGDFESLTGRFTLSLPDLSNASAIETASLISRYKASNTGGDPYLESLLFDYSTYLFVASSRPGSLPLNLQGRWSEGLYAAWSGDYHANINLQMNHWTPDQTGLTELQSPLWDYMQDNWVPRGSETAELLYGAPGWVVHNEMNIFGHTGMKSGASWANYAAAAAWMMQHVWDHWEYSQDADSLLRQGYPLLKGVAEFWLDQLQEDEFARDGTLVVNPCNSPEHGPTTFACVHYHQLIHQVFEAVLSANVVLANVDDAFASNVSSSLSRLDKGFHLGDWGQIKEWKLPDSFGYDFINDTHRHLSELVGWYPGYSISSFMGGYSNHTIQTAIEQKLYSRGFGNAEDANAGWAKVWRAACWARLNNTERAHFELRYAIEQNFAANGFSMYSAESTPFQIDANFGIGGAMLSMLVVDLPRALGETGLRTIVLGPAIPESWAGGFVKGLRLRGGGSVDFTWNERGLVTTAKLHEVSVAMHVVNKDGEMLAQV
ncbi:glycoside hydrolase family 95 protein-like protein [Ophiobolus disseminans]|uniref:Glycoside hydrolase family 95 protein-like protein n=1 Tax=Ophiobolus disseminans TaxID=1469910 RepID=A0A6A6ZY75_9PLEO|nr:glycoside hydrolase family 95 protein-like protein [Ophiobolus disseminans]